MDNLGSGIDTEDEMAIVALVIVKKMALVLVLGAGCCTGGNGTATGISTKTWQRRHFGANVPENFFFDRAEFLSSSPKMSLKYSKMKLQHEVLNL